MLHFYTILDITCSDGHAKCKSWLRRRAQLFFHVQFSIICCVLVLFLDGILPTACKFVRPFWFAACHLVLILIHIVWFIPDWLYTVNLLAFGIFLVMRSTSFINRIVFYMLLAGIAFCTMQLLSSHLFVMKESSQVYIGIIFSVMIFIMIGSITANYNMALSCYLLGSTVGLAHAGNDLTIMHIALCNVFWLHVLMLEIWVVFHAHVFHVFGRRLDEL